MEIHVCMVDLNSNGALRKQESIANIEFVNTKWSKPFLCFLWHDTNCDFAKKNHSRTNKFSRKPFETTYWTQYCKTNDNAHILKCHGDGKVYRKFIFKGPNHLLCLHWIYIHLLMWLLIELMAYIFPTHQWIIFADFFFLILNSTWTNIFRTYEEYIM